MRLPAGDCRGGGFSAAAVAVVPAVVAASTIFVRRPGDCRGGGFAAAAPAAVAAAPVVAAARMPLFELLQGGKEGASYRYQQYR